MQNYLTEIIATITSLLSLYFGALWGRKKSKEDVMNSFIEQVEKLNKNLTENHDYIFKQHDTIRALSIELKQKELSFIQVQTELESYKLKSERQELEIQSQNNRIEILEDLVAKLEKKLYNHNN